MTVANVNVTKVLFKRGNTIQNNSYTGVSGEISIDTQAKTIRIHDGVTAGGNIVTAGAMASYIPTDPTITSIQANVAAANAVISSITGIDTSLLANAATQQTQINLLNANISAANTLIPNLLAVSGNILPSANVTYSLGSEQFQWKELWVSNNTIYIGGTPIRVDGGTLLVNNAPVTGGISNTGDIVFNGGIMTGTDNLARMRVQTFNQTGYYSLTPGVDYSTAVWDNNGITFNDPIQNVYDAIIALTNDSIIELQINGNWVTVTYNGSSTPGMPDAPTLFVNETAVNGPLTVDAAELIIRQGTTSYVEINGTDFRVDVQDDIRMYANDTFVFVNRSTNDSIGIQTNDGDYAWAFGADGTTQFPSSTIDAGTNKIDVKSGDYAELWFSGADGTWQSNPNSAQNTYVYADLAGAGIQTVRGDDDQGGNIWNHTWRFNNNGNLILPAGGDILDSNGASVLGGGAATNEITNTDGVNTWKVSVANTGVISMTTGRGGIEFGAMPEVGGPQHLHIMRPAGQNSSTDLFFGDDYNYVKLPGLYGVDPNEQQGVEIGSSINEGTVHKWKFGTDGGTTLPAGGTITEGGGITGAIRLTPAGGANANQALVIYPTAAADGDHLHLTAGGGTTELYLGNDYHFVKLANGGNVEIRTDNGVGTSAVWNFGTEGSLTLPSGDTTIGNFFGSDAIISAPDATFGVVTQGNGAGVLQWIDSLAEPTAFAGITVNSPYAANIGSVQIYTGPVGIPPQNSWTFGPGGNLTLPNAGYLQVGSGIVAGFASSPAPVISGFSNISAENFTFLANGVNILSAVGGTYSNTNVAAYLSTITTGNVGAGNLTVINNFSSNVISANSFTYANGVNILSTISAGSTYSNVNVEAYIGSNISAYQTYANANAATQATSINSINANIGAYQTYANANIGTQAISINSINANIGAYQTYANANVVAIQANLGAYQTYANANIGTLFSGNTSTNANLGAFQTYANANVAALRTSITSLATNANTNVAAYLSTATINTTGNISGALANLTGTAVTGINALLAGPAFTPLANTMAGFVANVNNYTQLTIQNKNTGNDATADYIATADNGSDTVNYLDLGIINSGYDNTTPSNSLGNIVYAADSYIYAQGNTSNTNQSGGNLAIGTTTTNKTVKVFAGGITNNSVVATFSNTGMVVNGNITTTNKFVGDGSALTNVTVSVAGNIQGSGTNVNLVAGNFTATFDNTGVLTLPTNGGDEGGELRLGVPATNTTLTSRVTVDVYQDRFRIFDGSTKGVYVDLSQAGVGVSTLLNNRVSGFVNAGTFVTMDLIKATVTTGGNRGLSLATTTGTFSYNIGGTYGLSNSTGGGASLNAQTLTTTATTSIFGWSFGAAGDMQTYILTDTTNSRCYRITLMIGTSYNNNMISIERLI